MQTPRHLSSLLPFRVPLVVTPTQLNSTHSNSTQIWMRCFTPVDVKHRGKLWGGLAPPPHHSTSQDVDVDVDHDLAAGRWHRQLVCGLVTLFAQV